MNFKRASIFLAMLSLLTGCQKENQPTAESSDGFAYHDEYGVGYSDGLIGQENVFPFSYDTYTEDKERVWLARKEEPVQSVNDTSKFSAKIWVGMNLSDEYITKHSSDFPILGHEEGSYSNLMSTFIEDEELPNITTKECVGQILRFPSRNTYYIVFKRCVTVHLNLSEIMENVKNSDLDVVYSLRFRDGSLSSDSSNPRDSAFAYNTIELRILMNNSGANYYASYQ